MTMADDDDAYYGGDSEMSPNVADVTRGFDQSRYTPWGVDDPYGSYMSPLSEEDVPVVAPSPEPKPPYDRNIV